MKAAVYRTTPKKTAAKPIDIVSPEGPYFSNFPGLITSGLSTPNGPPVLPFPNLFSKTAKRSLEELIIQLDRPGQTTKVTSIASKAPTPAKIIRNLSSSLSRADPPGVRLD